MDDEFMSGLRRVLANAWINLAEQQGHDVSEFNRGTILASKEDGEWLYELVRFPNGMEIVRGEENGVFQFMYSDTNPGFPAWKKKIMQAKILNATAPSLSVEMFYPKTVRIGPPKGDWITII